MNVFDNTLIIKDEAYEKTWFPKIPNFRKQNSAFILTDGTNDSILINEHTTTKDIRQGKYTRLVEVSTSPYIKEITFNTSGREVSFSFRVYVKAIIQVKDPLVFYNNKNVDVEAYFHNLFALDVGEITQEYSILDYKGMDAILKDKLSACNTFDPSTGFAYQVSNVKAEPDDEAKDYVRKHDLLNLEASLRSSEKAIGKTLIATYEEAMWAEVASGKITSAEAIKNIQEFNNLNFEKALKRINELRDDGYITDADAKETLKQYRLHGQRIKIETGSKSKYSTSSDMKHDPIRSMYREE